jgi:pimeloyl-ACP methyl ester carboxylesterase
MPTVTVPGWTLHYDVTDMVPPWVQDPETLVFHHGLGASGGIWAGWLPVLAGHYRLVRFDMRGHGRSVAAPPDAPFSLADLTHDLLAVADAAGCGRFHLVGESMGGTIALKTAIEQPQRVLTLTVSNGAHLGASIQSVQDWAGIIAQRGMAGWSAHMMERRFFPGTLPEEAWRWYERQQAQAAPAVLLHALGLLVGTDLSAALGRAQLPVLLLHGDSSPFIPVAAMADLQARLPQARLRVFPHARHGLPFSHARECAQELERFLAERRPGA